MAVANKHIGGAVILLHCFDGNEIIQALQGQIALVEQVIGRGAKLSLRFDNQTIDIGQLLSEVINIVHIALNTRVDLLAQPLQLRREFSESTTEALSFRQQ